MTKYFVPLQAEAWKTAAKDQIIKKTINMRTVEKRDYEGPAMTVVDVRHETVLLAGSPKGNKGKINVEMDEEDWEDD